jgi:hypothetical protein
MVIRRVLAGATGVFAVLGLAFREDARWFAASGACGLLWWAWDAIREHVIGPAGAWLSDLMAGSALMGSSAGMRPSLEETIRLLEAHLAAPTSRKVDLNAAIRLEEIYRIVKRDPENARRVIGLVLERYPDAPELKRFREEGREG